MILKIINQNKKAVFDYEILDEFKAGIMLSGSEIKSVRKGNVNLKGSYVSVHNARAFLKGAHISRYPYDCGADYDPFRDRELLLNKSELHKIVNHLNTQGVTIVPLAIGLEGKYAKLKIGVARGKKKHDKRESIKKREAKRQIDRAMKRHI
ncbi:SsrA-binding protein SmpB [Patescibacteria group bacterium]|nr:SsrA-binding protein SmpB [Patescibacteria group bacterium]MBU1015874.1 SsrA-binding protein SmpB [Patescibacteria group bacterium]MBU1685377.1 SsrA-binding protein SmpB [Patescibacteria group bacterium]MBU1938464.1 SsrA-binding protein SmpB [Patescibacteria group bacterium]